MPYVPIEKMLTEEKPSLYKLVLVAAMRANELSQGAQPLVSTDSKKVAVVALEEIAAGKVHYDESRTKDK